jgi:ABC-type dipeptide/oligopeptide/nickel transport system ATPase component
MEPILNARSTAVSGSETYASNVPLLSVTDLRIGVRTAAPHPSARLTDPANTRVLVDGVSFEVRAGETFALVGESGSGKTLSALTALGFLPEPGGLLLGGRVAVEGRDVFALDRTELRKLRGARVGLIFQEPGAALDPLMRVGDQLREAWDLHPELAEARDRDPKNSRTSSDLREAAIRTLLDQVGLPERVLAAWPHELSGGMQQRAMIALALLPNPRLLIADEPTTALDVTIQAQVLDLLGRLQRERGLGILFITHNLALVAQYADRLAVMEHGLIVESGNVTDFFRAPQHPYSQRLLAAVPRL